MDTVVTDEQRALLDVSTRFMDDTCPLRVVRDGAWKDDAFAASYRKQAADLRPRLHAEIDRVLPLDRQRHWRPRVRRGQQLAMPSRGSRLW